MKEHIAIAEAKKLGIPTFAIVDTNSDPTLVDFPIPANDDASKSIEKIMDILCVSIAEGLSERKQEREKIKDVKDPKEGKKESSKKEETVEE